MGVYLERQHIVINNKGKLHLTDAMRDLRYCIKKRYINYEEYQQCVIILLKGGFINEENINM